MTSEAPQKNGQGQTQPSETGRVNNYTQRVAQWKQQVRSFPRSKKLEKLAIYSSCKVSVTSPRCQMYRVD